MNPPCTRMYTHPFFEATSPGAAPGPPVKARARVRHFRGCKKLLVSPCDSRYTVAFVLCSFGIIRLAGFGSPLSSLGLISSAAGMV